MAQFINLPIRFRFLKIPAAWEFRTIPRPKTLGGPVSRLCGQPTNIPLDRADLVELDGWQCRDEFLSLPEKNIDALQGFLNKVGVWDPDYSRAALDRKSLYLDVERVWTFREEIRDALLYQKEFMARVTPELPSPKTPLDLIGRPHASNDFRLRFELTKVAAGVVTITNAHHMILATVFADIAKGIRFKSCLRKDCPKPPFPVQSKHARKYCSQPCGHLESVRKQRRKEKQRKERRISAEHTHES